MAEVATQMACIAQTAKKQTIHRKEGDRHLNIITAQT